MVEPVLQTNLGDIKLFTRGKVRDIYDFDDRLLIVATDRVSAFDVVMPNGIPEKGKYLTEMSLFWFEFTSDIVDNHLITARTDEYPIQLHEYSDLLEGRSMMVKKAKPIALECVVRGYLAGSGYKDYMKTGAICGITLPGGLKEGDCLEKPLFTPATKASTGHDENISTEDAATLFGWNVVERLRDLSLTIYGKARDYARTHAGIIIADTKFEFGFLENEIILIDEVLSPDSSRFWPLEGYKPGKSQPSFDKQFVRDYLEGLDWDKKPPAPVLPDNIVEKTIEKYREARDRLIAKPQNC